MHNGKPLNFWMNTLINQYKLKYEKKDGDKDKGDQEYSYHDEHWVRYDTVETLYCR